MRPALKSGLLPLWRDRDTVQIGIDPRRAVALTGIGEAADLIGLLDGSRDREQVLAAAARRGIPVLTTERILTLLAAGGVLDDFPAGMLRDVPAPLRARLAAELATASLAYRDGDGGYRVIARRRAARIRIEGERRVGKAIARILSGSGIGHIRIGQANPGRDETGQARADLIRPRRTGQARADLIRPRRTGQASPGQGRTARDQTGHDQTCGAEGGPGRAERADLVILVGRAAARTLDRLVIARIPHLAVSAAEAIGVVGPLVTPGKTACLRCLDYFRAASDPSWPLILAQLADRRADPPACDALLAAAVATQAAAQALIAIDKSPASSAAANGTLELVLPGWQWRRRTWAADPACPCSGHTAA
jgi:bacteriocin biosynthesis cyclodehydratase domain-containing protein